MDGPEFKMIAFDLHFRDFQYGYDGVLAKERKVYDALKTLPSSAKDVLRHAGLLCIKVPDYNDRSKTDICEGIASFLMRLRTATNKLARKRDLGAYKSVNVKFL